MNLRDVCQLEGFDTALLTTYQFDPLFFERVVLRDLRAAGTRRIFVIADGQQASVAIARAQGQIVELGRQYHLITVWHKGAFHPKLCVRISDESAIVACGSTNLTQAGWLGTRTKTSKNGNREATSVWRVQAGSAQMADLSQLLRSLQDLIIEHPSQQSLKTAIHRGWIQAAEVAPEGRLILSSGARPLCDVIGERWRERRFRRMWMTTGSTDRHGKMLKWAHEQFGVQEAIVELDPTTCIFDSKALARLPMRVRIRPTEPRPRTHLKIVVFEGGDGFAAIAGSANCSAAAWTVPPSNGGNIEAVVVFDKINRKDIENLVPLTTAGAVLPSAVEFATSTEREDQNTWPSLVFASWSRTTRTVTATFRQDIPPATSVVLQIGDVACTASSISPRQWTAKLHEFEDESRTHFLTAAIGKPRLLTNECWIECIDTLRSLESPRVDMSSLKGLSGASSADPSESLRGLAKLGQWLLGLQDGNDEASRSVRGVTSSSTRESAEPVTAEMIFRSLEDRQKVHSHSHSLLKQGGISFAGILQAVFGDPDQSSANGNASIIDDERRAGSSNTADDEESDDDVNDTDLGQSSEITPEMRRSLIRQMKSFVKGLGDENFGSRATATQLQQAAGFPLACALLAARGGWIQTAADHDEWRAVVGGVCELLLTTQSGQKGDGIARSLLDRVRARYFSAGREGQFHAILGDGTLWVLLLAATTSSPIDVDEFERDLILTEVLECTVLRSEVSSTHLAELCEIARIREVNCDWISQLKQSHKRVSRILKKLSKRPEPCSMLNAVPKDGDWLWSPRVGFARLEEVEDGGHGLVHIRSRATTRSNVQLARYFNLRLEGLL